MMFEVLKARFMIGIGALVALGALALIAGAFFSPLWLLWFVHTGVIGWGVYFIGWVMVSPAVILIGLVLHMLGLEIVADGQHRLSFVLWKRDWRDTR